MTNQELSVKEAADLAGISARHMRRLLADGDIPGRKVGHWVWIVRRDDVLRWSTERQLRELERDGRR